MKKTMYISVMLFVSLILCTGCFDKKEDSKTKPDDFNIKLIKQVNKKGNYLISPYSIEIALNMLGEGANGNTKKQIDSVLPDRKINNVSVKDRINVANGVFIKDDYKDLIRKEFKNTLANDYDSEIIYDKFKTPDVINNWVNTKTDGMIEKILDRIEENFTLGLANAIAIDVDWASEFECQDTKKQEFTKIDGKKINVEMMHNSYKSKGYKYLKSDDATGVVIPYKSYDVKTGKVDYDGGRNLEFIGILPEKDVETYVNNLSSKKLNKLIDNGKEASSKYEIKLALPRFTYEYEVPKFGEVLESMGIKDAFNPKKADFTNIMNKKDMKDNLYVGTAIHKTYIDLNESGTRAAAVTYFGVDAMGLPDEKGESVEIKFNRPFVYMIRDSKTKEILFFGAVYEPNIWKGSTCKVN